MTNQFKNKWFYVLIAMVLGMVIAAWGWDKNESTDPARTHGAVFMIVAGLVLFFGAVGYLFMGSNRKG
jgi:glucose uptake protein GlcU